jgi:RNA polymerase sigma-70 factor (sigma-E family)
MSTVWACHRVYVGEEVDGLRQSRDGFREFVLSRGAFLLRTAVLLTHDRHDAEDLVQTALCRAWRSWQGIEGEPEAYVRRIVVREFLRSRERRWTDEEPTQTLPEPGTASQLGSDALEPADVVSTRLPLVAAMARLPHRQRAVMVLRYYHDLTLTQVAAELGIAVGTVKTHHARALAAMRLDDDVVDLIDDGRSLR